MDFVQSKVRGWLWWVKISQYLGKAPDKGFFQPKSITGKILLIYDMKTYIVDAHKRPF